MILNNDPLKYTDQQERKHFRDHFLLTEILKMYGVAPFLAHSLDKIKENVRHSGLRKIIDQCIHDHHSQFPYHHYSSQEFTESTIGSEFKTPFAHYAKVAFQKVVKEQEYLQKMLGSLDADGNCAD